MANRYTRSNSITVELTADSLDQRDKEVMQALVTAGALVALSDGRPKAVERDELLNFIDRQGFVPTISRHEIAEAFDNRVPRRPTQREHDRGNLCPLAGLSLASVVVCTADRVAAADRKIRPGESQPLKLKPLITMTLPSERPPRALRTL
jgi:tellurite resistance protein